MKKKAIICIIIILIILIAIIAGISLSSTSKEEKKGNTSQKADNPYGTNLNTNLPAKAMIYVADEYSYTTEDYLIDVSENNDVYVVDIKTKDNQPVKQISIDKATLKKWKPTTASPEKTETVDDSLTSTQSAN